MDQSALILDQTSLPCAVDRCGSLASFMRRSLRFKHVEEQHSALFPATISFAPDVILLRLSDKPASETLVSACKAKWDFASILAVFCPGWTQPINEVPSLLWSVDDFLSCPFEEAEFCLRIERLLQSKRKGLGSSFTQDLNGRSNHSSLVGKSESFLRVLEKIPLLAGCNTIVLISGETGSGKEVIARAIHYQSPRQGKPFIPVNCGALPDHLFENEVFGHAKGAFTDASSAEKGLIAEAEGGTLFLDEIDSLSMAAQVKLLRFLENGEYRPLGSSRSKIADVRVIAATNADLVERIKARAFRDDLYYRLNALSVSIPPLRERIEDVVPLANHFSVQYAREHGQEPRGISKGALQKLMAHTWPGNVRELEGVLRRALILTPRQTLQREDIDLPLGDVEGLSASRQAMKNTIEVVERDYLTNLLTTYHGNITHAAKAAGKQRRTLQRLLQKYTLDRYSFRL